MALRTPGWFDPNNPMDNPPICPLVLDLDGNGLDLIHLANSSAYFDLNMTGFANWTAWIGGGDGFLALDINGNGLIDDLSELFGATEYNDPDDHGFAKLSLHDLNGDGVIDHNDAVFSDLRVWRDLNGDGRTGEGELFTLAGLGIASISVAATFTNVWQGDNWISHTATFTRNDGSVETIYDVWFDHSLMHTIYDHNGTEEIDPELALLRSASHRIDAKKRVATLGKNRSYAALSKIAA